MSRQQRVDKEELAKRQVLRVCVCCVCCVLCVLLVCLLCVLQRVLQRVLESLRLRVSVRQGGVGIRICARMCVLARRRRR